MINSRNLNDLHPKVAVIARMFVDRCRAKGIDVLIYSTYRDNESQAELYAQGRTKPGRKVTNAKPGQSWHNWRCALDFVPMFQGKPQWNDTSLYEQCGEIAESIGFEWAGRWKRFREFPHIQYTGGNTLAQFQNGTQDMSRLA